jgi:hypothetical protein
MTILSISVLNKQGPVFEYPIFNTCNERSDMI